MKRKMFKTSQRKIQIQLECYASALFSFPYFFVPTFYFVLIHFFVPVHKSKTREIENRNQKKKMS